MGNCINHGALSPLAEEKVEEWEWAESGKRNKTKRSAVAAVEEEEEEERLMEEKKARRVEAPASNEVKIKITKKQLEELLRNVEGGGLLVQQMLAGLVSGGGGDVDHAVAQWRPALQSIPETAES